MIVASRKIHFCAGHRVYKHESKCATLHGHNYVAWITVRAPELDSLGRIIDFSVIKEKVGGWIDYHWDHTMVLYNKDEKTIAMVDSCPKKKATFIMNKNPTAENMADYLLKVVCPECFKGTEVEAIKVVLYETENCYAEANL